MCSIFGAFGNPNETIVKALREAAADRGRDGGRMVRYQLAEGNVAFLGNWRATPTPEVEEAELQPYNGMVHNGTIANDKELGGKEGEVDSMVLSRVLNRSSVGRLVSSLQAVKGSYALACHNGSSVLLACNYKPIHYYTMWGVSQYPTVYFSSMERHFRGIVPFGQRPAVLTPYSALDLATMEHVPIPRMVGKRAVVVASGGLDSTVAAALLLREGYEVCLLHFLYSCRAESREARAVAAIGTRMGCSWQYIQVPYSSMRGASSIVLDKVEKSVMCRAVLPGERVPTDEEVIEKYGPEISGPVEGAEYAHEWVPARNLVFLSLAIAYAEANRYSLVALGNNLEEAGAYPDNEEEFTGLVDRAADYAVQNGVEVRVKAPVGRFMKHEIVKMGTSLGVPWELTWSCYRGGERHCGNCGPCFMRRTAFERSGMTDPVFAKSYKPLPETPPGSRSAR